MNLQFSQEDPGKSWFLLITQWKLSKSGKIAISSENLLIVDGSNKKNALPSSADRVPEKNWS
jgi:hypothetical protein